MKQTTGLDASFVYLETPTTPQHIAGLQILDQSEVPGGYLRFKDILAEVEARLHLAPTFRQRLVKVPFDLDHPYWVEDPDFDLEYHVRHIALPKPGDWRQLCILVARIHSRPLDMNRPLWEFYVIEGLDKVEGLPKGSFALLSRYHHSAIDGVAGAQMLAAICDLEPGGKPEPPEAPWKSERMPDTLSLMGRAYLNTLRRPLRSVSVLANHVPQIAKVAAGIGSARNLQGSGSAPRTRFNEVITAHRVWDGVELDLGAVRAIKSHVAGATVNDAIISIVAGALRLYLDDKDELPDESLITMAPISVRSDDQAGTGGNKISAMFTPMRTDIADPLDRIEAIHEGSVNSKQMSDAVGASVMADVSQVLPGTLVGLAARALTPLTFSGRMMTIANCIVTNVPGPQLPLYMFGAKLHSMYGVGQLYEGMGLIHPIFSYNGKITISFSCCRAMMPDPAFYATCIRASYEAHKEAIGLE